MLTCVFMGLLALVWTIVVMGGIFKVSVENRSIVFKECAIFMSISTVYRVSKTYLILDLNVLESWFLCGFR